MFRYFEKLLPAYPVAEPGLPPRGLLPFLVWLALFIGSLVFFVPRLG